MKKETLKTALIGAIAGAIVAGGTSTVIAYTINSNNVNFTPTDSAWKVNSVAEAIDDLYIKKTGDNYSTEERVVGTWIDGKPLYQKTITGTTPNASGYVSISVSNNVSNCHVIAGYYVDSSNYYADLNYDEMSAGYGIATAIKGDGTSIYMAVGSGSKNRPFVMTVQYTKTTDQVQSNEQAG